MMPSPVLTAALSERIEAENERRKAAMDARAKYKMQIWFRSNRSTKKPLEFSLSFWESGKRLHGGGDEALFLCRRNTDAPRISLADQMMVRNGRIGCDSLISGEIAEETGVVVCPNCYTRHKLTEIGDAIFYRLTVDQAAEKLAWWFRKIGGNADLYAKYCPTDPRVAMMSRHYDARTAQEKKGLTIYPLANLLKDTLAGASLEGRIKAFITA